MKKIFLLTTATVVALPLAASAETINLYGWQNHSYEFVDQGQREYSRIQANAANIGFNASVETGVGDMRVNLQCEQFTYVNQYAGGTGWCNRNSKIGLSTSSLGEIMFATWLLPYNEAVAQWVDPFYDAGADSHTSIMGSVGAYTIFYNTGQFESSSTGYPAPGEFNYGAVDYDQGFNRRQENIIQYWSPNLNGFVFRFAMTAGTRDETRAITDFNRDRTPGNTVTPTAGPFANQELVDGNAEIDPRIYSTSLAYENGPLWLAATYQKHEDWAAATLRATAASSAATGSHLMTGSDADSYRLAARYIFDLGGGTSVQLAAMYEDLEYEFEGTIDHREALVAFGFAHAGRHDTDDPTFGSRGIGGFVDDGTGETVFSTSTEIGSGNIAFERSAWMVSGKVKFGGPVDFRFSYMDADDIDLRCAMCPSTWDETAADAWNIGLFYTMPAGTELRMTYSEVTNDFNGTYGQGISGTGLGTPGGEVEMLAFGIVHWFD